MTMLTNSERGDLLYFAVKNALLSHCSIFELRVWIFVVVEKTDLSAYRLADYLMPPWTSPIHKLFSSRIEIVDWIIQDPCPLLRGVIRQLDVIDY